MSETRVTQLPQTGLKALIAKGKEQGYLTYTEVNDHLPESISDPDQVEDIIQMIDDMGIKVYETAPDADQLLLIENSETTDELAAAEAAAALAAVENEAGRTTDPVRMYMREMGTVELLTRGGEIAIAKLREELAQLATIEGPAAAAAMSDVEAKIAGITRASEGGLNRALGDLRAELAQMRENFAAESIEAMRSGLSDLFVSIADGSKSAKDALRDFAQGFAQAMLRIAADALATMAVIKLLEAVKKAAGVGSGGAGGGGSFLASLFHSGGIVGEGGASRRVPGYIFAGAARYHDGGITGLKPGEVPAILNRGEEVLTANDPRHAANGGGAAGQISIRSVIVDDRGNIGDFMSSADGERVLLDFVERNSLSIKRLVG